jgi:NDP-sugar pyrophosphorylase family protein
MGDSFKATDLDFVILCGGLGTRLRTVVNDRPKPMAEVNGRPFLDILMEHAASFGFRRFILCTGYMSEKIKDYYTKQNSSLEIVVSEEKEPLGTAGAIKNAESLIRSNPFIVANGDSFCALNLKDFLAFYQNKKALFSIALTKVEKGNEYGAVEIDEKQKVIVFKEKAILAVDSLVNAGVYIFDKMIFKEITNGQKVSLEYGVFPHLADKDFYGYITRSGFLDIGTPERYALAQQGLI